LDPDPIEDAPLLRFFAPSAGGQSSFRGLPEKTGVPGSTSGAPADEPEFFEQASKENAKTMNTCCLIDRFIYYSQKS
jgi:hypothetical protein